MRLAKELFVGDSVTELSEIVYALQRNLPILHVYCIVKEAGEGPVAILSARELARLGASGRELTVFGVAQGKQGAYRLLAEIVTEARRAGWPVARLGAYLEQSEGEEG